MESQAPPEHNVTGIDYADRWHFRYGGAPLVDIHSHIMQTHLPEGKTDPGYDPLAQARTMLEVAAEFGIEKLYSMCPDEDIEPLRREFGDRIGFNGSIVKVREAPDEDAYRLLDCFLEHGVEMIKFWAAPRGRERGLLLDTPWRVEAARRARAAGIRIFMVHVADPDVWFRTTYADSTIFGTKEDQYRPLRMFLEMVPDVKWIGAHMGGDPEHPDHLEALLERYPHLYFDTSATKWQVREVSPRADAIRSLICRYPDRFLFGSDLVTRHGLVREHYVSRYWCQRTLWESDWHGPSPIADPDSKTETGEPTQPQLTGVNLPADVLEKVYRTNALQLLGK
jgi:predicted TIM-barrel fold metal-dependent hydrolase